MGKALYIYENDELTLAIDGPSIWIKKPLQAGQRIPLRLISRVYLVGNTIISTELILALAESNIPLIVAKPSGEDKAILLPHNQRLAKYYKEQIIILENKNTIRRYIDWIDTYRSYLQLKTISRFLPREGLKKAIGEGDYNYFLSKLMPENRSFWFPVKNTVNYMLRGLIVENIIKAKLDLHIGAYFRRANFGFVLDMNHLLEPKADEQTIMFFRHKNYQSFFHIENKIIKLNKEGHKNIAHRFENKKDELEDLINKIIDDFFYLIRELHS